MQLSAGDILVNPDPYIIGKRCLVLDDEFLIALDIQQTLEAAGAANVISVGNASEAMDLLAKNNRFDLAVLDIKLGDATGNSTTVAVALAEQGTPFVFLTGMRADEVAVQFADVPVVEKPYQSATLINALRQALMGNNEVA